MTLSAGAIVGYSILGTFGAYVCSSVVLLNFPTIVHKKKKRTFYCTHISHRGGAAERTENTLTAYQHAVNIGTDMLELDVHLTKDKQVVVAHDLDLERMCGIEGKTINDYDYQDLPVYLDRLKVTFSSHLEYVNQTGVKERMPLLSDVFNQHPHIPVNLDVKDDDDELIAKTNEVIRSCNRESMLVWGNFTDPVCQKLYKLNPRVPILFSIKRVALTYLWFYTGLLPFIPLKESFMELPYPQIMKRYVSDEGGAIRRFLVRFLVWMISSPILFNHLSKRGIPTYFWVLNEEEQYEGAFKLGAEGVMTDCPTKLMQWLNNNPQYKTHHGDNDKSN